MRKDYQYPESMAEKVWEKDGIQYSLVKHRDFGHYCGYCRFDTRPVLEKGYRGLMAYVPVHGGITYAELDEDGTMVYGFDCNHAHDEMDSELRDIEWLTNECESMALGIKTVADYELQYLKATTDEVKANVIDEYHDKMESYGIGFNVSDNFGAMIGVLFGSL